MKQQIKYVLIIFIIVVAIITALKLFNIIYVSQMVGAFILVVIFLIVILSGTIASKTVPKLGKDVIITFVIILGLLVFTTYISVSTQIFPINSIQSQFDLGGMTIILNRAHWISLANDFTLGLEHFCRFLKLTFSSRSLRSLDCWLIDRLCTCLFEKHNVKTSSSLFRLFVLI